MKGKESEEGSFVTAEVRPEQSGETCRALAGGAPRPSHKGLSGVRKRLRSICGGARFHLRRSIPSYSGPCQHWQIMCDIPQLGKICTEKLTVPQVASYTFLVKGSIKF